MIEFFNRLFGREPSSTTEPDDPRSPVIAFSTVDFPAPFVPNNATSSPGATTRSTPKSTWSDP